MGPEVGKTQFIYLFYVRRLTGLVGGKNMTWRFLQKRTKSKSLFIKKKKKVWKSSVNFFIEWVIFILCFMQELKFQTAKSTGWDHVVIGWSTLQHNKVVIDAFTFEMVQCTLINQLWFVEMAQSAHTRHSQNSRHCSSLSALCLLYLLQDIAFLIAF